MLNFYFTYGTAEYYPFRGGWTKVTAPNKRLAIEKFREVHPDRIPNTLNCVDYYCENDMKDMLITGNRGAFEHEHLIC